MIEWASLAKKLSSLLLRMLARNDVLSCAACFAYRVTLFFMMTKEGGMMFKSSPLGFAFDIMIECVIVIAQVASTLDSSVQDTERRTCLCN